MHRVAPKHIDWIVRPGKGSTSLFIGGTEGDVVTLLGQPQSIVSKFEGHRYYLYPQLGLQVDFNPQTRFVKTLAFHRSGVNGYRQSPAETTDGLTPGVTKRKVLDVLGMPNKSNAGTESVRAWLWYQQGIQFDLGERDVVDVMIIFDPRISLEEQCL
jgi:outer membrane protein assembly factor BamE (lipoprotein component of BamABCDE complex)